MLVKNLVLAVARLLGTQFVDTETGKSLGRVFAIAWKGKIHVIGLAPAVRPIFLPQKRVTYWKQEIGFAKPPAPDFPSLPRVGESDGGSETPEGFPCGMPQQDNLPTSPA